MNKLIILIGNTKTASTGIDRLFSKNARVIDKYYQYFSKQGMDSFQNHINSIPNHADKPIILHEESLFMKMCSDINIAKNIYTIAKSKNYELIFILRLREAVEWVNADTVTFIQSSKRIRSLSEVDPCLDYLQSCDRISNYCDELIVDWFDKNDGDLVYTRFLSHLKELPTNVKFELPGVVEERVCNEFFREEYQNIKNGIVSACRVVCDNLKCSDYSKPYVLSKEDEQHIQKLNNPTLSKFKRKYLRYDMRLTLCIACNSEPKYLKRLLDSIETDEPYELLCIGTTAPEYGHKIESDRTGDAWNIGIEKARGEFIFFLVDTEYFKSPLSDIFKKLNHTHLSINKLDSTNRYRVTCIYQLELLKNYDLKFDDYLESYWFENIFSRKFEQYDNDLKVLDFVVDNNDTHYRENSEKNHIKYEVLRCELGHRTPKVQSLIELAQHMIFNKDWDDMDEWAERFGKVFFRPKVLILCNNIDCNYPKELTVIQFKDINEIPNILHNISADYFCLLNNLSDLSQEWLLAEMFLELHMPVHINKDCNQFLFEMYFANIYIDLIANYDDLQKANLCLLNCVIGKEELKYYLEKYNFIN